VPHIKAIFPYTAGNLQHEKVVGLIKLYKRTLREIIAERYGYRPEEIVLIAEPKSDVALECSDNLPPLTLEIDTGKRPGDFTDCDARMIRQLLLERAGMFKGFHFAIWIREMSSNGWSEHKPG